MTRSSYLPGATSSDETFAALIGDRGLRELAELLAPPALTGRPRLHHPHLMLSLILLIHATRRTYRRHVVEISSPYEWEKLRAIGCEHGMEEMPEKPPTLAQLNYFHKTFLAPKEARRELEAFLLEQGSALAASLNLCQGGASAGTLSHPSALDVIAGDGTTVGALWRSSAKNDANLKFRRFDVDAASHKDGTKRVVIGHKFIYTQTRGTDPGQRIYLTMGLQESGDEAAEAVDHVSRSVQQGLRPTALLYDGAMRGTHHSDLIRRTGVFVVNRIASAESSEDGKGKKGKKGKGTKKAKKGKKVHKKTLLEATACVDCGTVDRFWAHKGAVCVSELDAAGAAHLVPLEGLRVKRRGHPGSYRIYLENTHTCACGTRRQVRLPVHNTRAGDARNINYAENLRPVPEDSADFKRLYGGRSDAENSNDNAKRFLDRGRSRKLGAAGTHVEMLAFAIAWNATLGFLLTG